MKKTVGIAIAAACSLGSSDAFGVDPLRVPDPDLCERLLQQYPEESAIITKNSVNYAILDMEVALGRVEEVLKKIIRKETRELSLPEEKRAVHDPRWFGWLWGDDSNPITHSLKAIIAFHEGLRNAAKVLHEALHVIYVDENTRINFPEGSHGDAVVRSIMVRAMGLAREIEEFANANLELIPGDAGAPIDSAHMEDVLARAKALLVEARAFDQTFYQMLWHQHEDPQK